jgi:GTP-binding protein HflX
VREADILLHVVDISHSNFEDQINVVNQTLTEIGAGNKPMYLVFNKIDAFSYEKKDDDDLSPVRKENLSLEDLSDIWLAKNEKSFFISAEQKMNIEDLRERLYEYVKTIHASRFPYNDFLY